MKRNLILGKSKRWGSVVAVVILIVAMNITAYAAESHNELCNVSTEAPKGMSFENVSVYGLNRPDSSSYVDLMEKKLTFSGNASGSILYTNKNFKGKSTVNYSITNDHEEKLTVKVYTSGGWKKVKTLEIEGEATLTGTIKGLDKDKLYFLSFSAPSDFSGSVY